VFGWRLWIGDDWVVSVMDVEWGVLVEFVKVYGLGLVDILKLFMDGGLFGYSDFCVGVVVVGVLFGGEFGVFCYFIYIYCFDDMMYMVEGMVVILWVLELIGFVLYLGLIVGF